VSDAIYEERNGALYASAWARGPWDENAQHGGPPAAVLMRALERLDDLDGSLQLARVTYELIRPAPLGELHASAEIVRPGRRIQLLEASLRTPEGTEVVKARALRIARAPLDAGRVQEAAPPGPEGLRGDARFAGGAQMYVNGGMEVRLARGHFYQQGPAFAWFRLARELVAGETPSPLQRLVAAADFPNGISSEVSWDEYVFINPDLTVYVEREPRGEWIGLDARTRIVKDGIGLAQAVLYDEYGRIGRSLQALYVAPR
jgi:hypothetical protein